MPEQRETSSDAQSTQDSNKARKTQHGQSATSSGRIRRAARGRCQSQVYLLITSACDSCRGSKLRCEAADPASGETRCAHCLKMDLECTFDNPLPSHVVERTRQVDDKDGRLTKLENNVARLLDIMERNSADRAAPQVEGNVSAPDQTNASMPDLAQSAPHDQSSMHVLAHVAGEPPSGLDNLDNWTGPDPLNMTLFNNPTPAPPPSASFSAPLPAPWTQSGATRWDEMPVMPASPPALADTPHSHHSNRSSIQDRHASAQARPIPKYGTASRMAAFTDPLSHEAPFRSLTYNPDTFRNVELAEEGPDESMPTTGSSGTMGRDDGGKTPKRGVKDPIDNGVMGEAEARALFTLCVH